MALGVSRRDACSWALILFLLGAAVCASAVASVDDPETAFDETDIPINLYRPEAPSIKFVPPADGPLILLRPLCWPGRGVSSLALELAPAPKQRYPHSLQNLLCTFLI